MVVDAVATTTSRSTEKRQAVIEAATSAFLARGFLATTMDEIAAAAGVSKQTVYKHFSDKDTLFTAAVRVMVDEASDRVHAEVQKLQETGNLAMDLCAFARRQLEVVLQPRLMQLRRLVIAEALRFPELGLVFYERGPARTIEALADTFKALALRGILDVDDPHVAAEQFNWLVMATALNEAMLLVEKPAPSRRAIDRWATTGVATFLAAHAAPKPATVTRAR